MPSATYARSTRIDNAPRFDITRVMDDARLKLGPSASAEAIADYVLAHVAFFEREQALRQAVTRLAQPMLVVPEPVPDERPYNTLAGTRSSKWEAVARAADDPLTWRVRVGGEWKLLAECTAADLRAISYGRRERAAQLTGEAERYERLATMLEESGKTIVGDLGEDVAREVLA